MCSLSCQSKVINTHTNSNVSQKQHQQNVLQIEDNPLLLTTNSLGDSSTSKSSNHNHNKPLVQCNIQGLKFNALLDACSTGPEGYIVNYIHPDVVQQIKNHQSKIKTPFIKKCNCSRASTCTGAGCFETSTCITLNIFRDYDLSKIFRHFFASSNPIINQSSSAHSSNLPEENLDSNDPSHERRHVESTSGSSTSHSSSSIVNEVRSSA